MPERRRVLISAYACEPGKGSEPEVGLRWALEAARQHQVTVVTRQNNLAALAEFTNPNLRFIGFDLPASLLALKRVLGTQFYYALWQVGVGRVFRRLHDEQPFDVVHHLTFASDWAPASVLRIKAPVRIWGPVGGRAQWPGSSVRWLGTRGALGEVRRQVATHVLRQLVGRGSRRRATLIFAQNMHASLGMAQDKVVIHPNVVVEGTQPRPWHASGRRGSMKIALAVGRLEPLKAHRLSIAALARLSDPRWTLVIAGNGADLPPLKRFAKRAGVLDQVSFRGHVAHDDLLKLMFEADIVLSTCMREAAGFASAEASSVGVPIAYVDRGGPCVILSGYAGGVAVPVSRNLLRDFTDGWRRGADIESAPQSLWSSARLVTLLSHAYSGASARELHEWDLSNVVRPRTR